MTKRLIEPAEDPSFKPQVCSACARERGIQGMDAYDYSPMQVLTGQPFGWYSGSDGELCPECITKAIRAIRGQ